MLFKLQDEAAAVGGEVHLLLGNHELMSMQGDQRYTSTLEMAAFGGAAQHMLAWSRSGLIGAEMRARAKAVVVVSDVVYVHGGVLPIVLAAYTDGMNGPEAVAELNALVLNQLLANDAAGLQWDTNSVLDPHDLSNAHPLSGRGLMWARDLVLREEEWACPALHTALKALGASRMVVGHCPQLDGDVLPRCGGRILAADTFLSEAYTKDHAASKHNEAALEFFEDSSQIFAIYPRRSPMCVPFWTTRDDGGVVVDDRGGEEGRGDGGGGDGNEGEESGGGGGGRGGGDEEGGIETRSSSSATMARPPFVAWRYLVGIAAVSWAFACFIFIAFPAVPGTNTI